MGSMFNNCASLISLDVSSFNTSNVTDMNRMFASCDALTSLDISSFDTGSVTNMQNMFSDMDNIETIYVSDNFVTNLVPDNNGTNMFRDDINIKGGQGTTFNNRNTNKTYARIDDPDKGRPGYFTKKTE